MCSPSHNHRHFPAMVKLIPDIRRFVREGGAELGVPTRVIQDMELAVEEVVVNAIRHGGARNINVILEKDQGLFQVCLQDDGKRFDPVKWQPLEPKGDLEQRPIGGLGIILVKKLTDSLTHEYHQGQNRTVLSICWKEGKEGSTTGQKTRQERDNGH